MKTSTTVATFVAGLATVFGTTYGLGHAVGPVGTPPASHDPGGHMTSTSTTPHAAHGTEGTTSGVPGGLMVSQEGYTLDLLRDTARAGVARQVEFTITGPDGRPVTQYEVEHEKELHLIAVRRDLTGFQHVHPHRDPDGTWSAPLELDPGPWKIFADFTPAGADSLTLGADLLVPGQVAAPRDAAPGRTAQVDGYTVTLTGDLTAGTDAELRLTVSKDGRPVTDLQPYLGAYGHLVALREGDLAYLHVHPDGEPGDGRTRPGPEVVFYAAVPSDGTYHLYLDFKHEGVVRTASFALATETGPTPEPAGGADQTHGPASDHDHQTRTTPEEER